MYLQIDSAKLTWQKIIKNINICHVKLEPHRSWSICSCFVSLKDCKWSVITYSANEFAWFLIDGEPPIKGKPPI